MDAWDFAPKKSKKNNWLETYVCSYNDSHMITGPAFIPEHALQLALRCPQCKVPVEIIAFTTHEGRLIRKTADGAVAVSVPENLQANRGIGDDGEAEDWT